MIELSVVDTRTIIRTVNEKYGFDLSQFALTSLKYKLAKLMTAYKFSKIDTLLYKLIEQPEFYDTFLHDLMVPTTEMYRDPSLWRWMREVYFPPLLTNNIGSFKIWFPLSVDGLELYTMLLVLKELNVLDKVKIFVSTLSNKSTDTIINCEIPLKKYEISAENFKRYQGSINFEEQIVRETYVAKPKKELLNNVEFVKQSVLFENTPSNVKLIFFRNHLIYLNPGFQDKVLTQLHTCLSASGHLVIGVKERIKNIASSNEYDIINEGESVYKKKFVKN